MSDLPTLVFVPGAWHQPTCYQKITKILQERYKLKCVSITLPSTSGNPKATLKDDIDVAREAISSETSAGRDVVVISHSYGGMVGNSAIKEFTQKAAPASTAGHVIGLILVASGFTLTGLAFMDPFFGHPPPAWRINNETGYAELVVSPRQFFYHDLSEDEAKYWTSQLTTQSLKALFEGGEHAYAGWQDVPVWYIGTVEDQGIPVVAQRLQIGAARAMGGHVEHRELQTSHSPFLSQPEETVEIMLDAIAAFTGNPTAIVPAKREQSHQIILPAPRLLQPLTWIKFGLPLVFGRLIGNGMLIFGWARSLFKSK